MVVLEILQRNLVVLARNPLAALLTVVVGVAVGFAYSYIPLHSSKLWEIEYLESRVQSQREHITGLEAKVQIGEARRKGLPEPGEFEALKTRVGEAEKRADELERERKSFKSKIKKLTRSRDDWRKKHDEAETRIAELERPAPAPAAAPGPATADPEPTPAAPAASPWPSEVTREAPAGLGAPPAPGAGTRPDLE